MTVHLFKEGVAPGRRLCVRARALIRVGADNWSGVSGLVIVAGFVGIALGAGLLSPRDPLTQNLDAALRPPGPGYLLGTDELGRDVLSRLVFGARASAQITFLAAGMGLLLGTAIGIAAAFRGGWVDEVLMRPMDVLLGFPGILLAITIASALGPGVWNIVVAVGLYSLPLFARLSRAMTLAVQELEFILAARAVGANGFRVVARHILPNISGPIVVVVTLRTATILLAASSLSYLGLGIPPPQSEWGAMLSDGRQYVRTAPHLVISAGLAITTVVLGFNLLGEWLRDRWDPRRMTART